MIYILDDTISQRKESVGFLQESPYSEICLVVEYPTLKQVREIFKVFSEKGNHLFCIHRSLMFYSDDAAKLGNSENIRNSIIIQANERKIDYIVFGRDINTNKNNKFVDKDLFYRNLELFLDNWNEGNCDMDILYEGAMYKIASRKRMLDEIITIVNMDENPYENPRLLNALREYFPGVSPDDVVSTWKRKEMSKREIRQYINEKL